MKRKSEAPCRAIKTRLDPTVKQTDKLSQHGGISRFVYNWGLEQRVDYYNETGKGLFFFAQNKLLTDLKSQFPWMYDVSKWVGQDALRNLDTAFSNYFNSLKKPAKKKSKKKKKSYTENQIKYRQHVDNYPKFKRKSGNKDSFSFPFDVSNGRNPNIEIKGNKIKFPKIGWIRMCEDLSSKIGNNKIVRATVSQDGKYWNVAIVYEFEIKHEVKPEKSVGIDLGIKSFAVMSDGTEVENPKYYRNAEAKLIRTQRWHSRKEDGSQNKKKSRVALQDQHRKVRNKRSDYIHKLTTFLTRNYSIICIEDLNVTGMMQNHHLAKSIWDAGFGEFRRQLTYKSEWTGSIISVIDRFFPSSKMCNVCGEINKELKLSQRTWVCICGAIHDRDYNASLNILTAGLAAITPLDLEAMGSISNSAFETFLE